MYTLRGFFIVFIQMVFQRFNCIIIISSADTAGSGTDRDNGEDL